MSITLVSGINTITLPNPMIGESYQFDCGVIVKRSKGQKLISNIPSNRKTVITHVLTFDNLIDATVPLLEAFLTASLGTEVTYTDHRGDSHTCLLLTPFNKIVQTGRQRHSTVIELEEIT